jgi:CMP-N,N'-diacetyllegionaminic acid synthase
MSRILGLITARGGSKAIPRKNVLPLCGKPLIAWTIEAALESRRLSRVVVSTDDEEIARVSKDWGAEVPFLRPAALARDDSPHVPVVLHAIQFLEESEQEHFDYILLLQPTSPFRTAADIANAIALALEKDADGVIGVTEASAHPFLTKRITREGLLEDFVPKPATYLARQSLPPVYVINGAIYLVKRDIFLEEQTFHPPRTLAYVMPPERSMDIDTPWDWHVAELILGSGSV